MIKTLYYLNTYSLNISKNQNAPYIAVGVITHDSECQVHIYNYDEEAEQLPSPVIKLGIYYKYYYIIILD